MGSHVALIVMVLYLAPAFWHSLVCRPPEAHGQKHRCQPLCLRPLFVHLRLRLDILRLHWKGGLHRPGVPAHLSWAHLSHDFGLDHHPKDDTSIEGVQADFCERLHQLPLWEKLRHRCHSGDTEPAHGHALCCAAAHSHIHFY